MSRLPGNPGNALITRISQEHLRSMEDQLYEFLSLAFKHTPCTTTRLTTTQSRLEHLLLTSSKEDLGLLSLLLTFNRFKTLIMGTFKLHHQ